jgi:hypothetical protein
MILHSDNGAEFHGAAMNDRQRKLHGTLLTLTNNDLAEVITEIKHLWPKCWMVSGSPRHSQSNGSVERVNRTVQSKLGAWMTGNKMVCWLPAHDVVLQHTAAQVGA